MEYNHWYDTSKDVRRLKIERSKFVCAMNQNTIRPDRLLRHFWVLALESPSDSVLTQVCVSILSKHFESKSLIEDIVEATLDLKDQVVSSFQTSYQNFHYRFNMREIVNVMYGLVSDQTDKSLNPIGQWMCLAKQAYTDRLVSDQEVAKYD